MNLLKIHRSALRCVFVFGLVFSSLQAEDEASPILLRGVLTLGDSQLFSLSDAAGTTTQWRKIGQDFEGYTLSAYNADEQTLTLQNDETSLVLGMAAATESSANASGTPEERLEEATALMTMMNFEKMMDDTLEAQMAAMAKMMREQMKRMSPGGEVDEELIEFQTKAMTEMFEEIDWKPIETGMAEVYADVFTQDELKGMSSFYTTPAGQASIEKMPEVQAKTMEVMMPAIMEASQAMQQKMLKFMEERARDGQSE